MNKYNFLFSLLFPLTLFISCTQTPKKLGTIETGMSKEAVIAIAGQPSGKNVINKTEIWNYPDSNRTVVFRADTVYTILTSPEARADSVGKWLDKTDDKLKDQLGDLAEKADSVGSHIVKKLKKDSSSKK